MNTNPQADQFFRNEKKWKDEFLLLREIVRGNKSLVEEFKWMHPCYTCDGKNIVLIHGFKEYCALLFHKGVLLKDPAGILVQQTKNVQTPRQIRFTHPDQIIQMKNTIRDYIREAVEVEKAGLTSPLKKVDEYPVPAELMQAFSEDEAFRHAFYNLTPGRQKAYLIFFQQAKQSKTREARIEKYYQQILDGKGMND